MARTKFVLMFFLMLLAAGLLTGPKAVAQSSTAQSGRADDIVFREIRLSIDGVIGVDSTGQVWKYDFGQGVFEKSSDAGVDRPGDRPTRDEAEMAVEIRCAEELRLNPFEKSVVVGRDEYVDGNVSALGKVTVRGWVKGSIESVGGPVIISQGGQVDGDIRSPEITVRRGGTHLGEQFLTNPLEFPKGLTSSFETAGLWVVFGLTLFFLLSTFLYLTLMPRQVDHFSHCVSRYPVKSAAVGLLFLFGLPVLIVLLAITLVGVLLIPFIPFAYFFAISLGVVTTSRLIGMRILRPTAHGEQSAMLTTAVGLLAIMAMWTLVALLMGSSSEVAFGFGIAALVISIIISCFPICSGIGAAVLTRFGFRPHISLRDRLAAEQAAVPAPAPPPIRRTTPFDVSGQSPIPPPIPGPSPIPAPPPDDTTR